jgi:hypothetical protein
VVVYLLQCDSLPYLLRRYVMESSRSSYPLRCTEDPL